MSDQLIQKVERGMWTKVQGSQPGQETFAGYAWLPGHHGLRSPFEKPRAYVEMSHVGLVTQSR